MRINNLGDPDFVDPSIEDQILAIAGIAQDSIPNGEQGIFVTSGRIKNLTTSLDFGDPVFLSKTGGLTNIRPSEGVGGFVAGDWILMIGVIARSEENPTFKDMIIHLDIQGQL